MEDSEAGTSGAEVTWEETTEGMDRSMLMARDPILFFDEVPLYESELDDNGVSQLRVKVQLSSVQSPWHQTRAQAMELASTYFGKEAEVQCAQSAEFSQSWKTFQMNPL